jgi:hypothetical protein
LLRDEPRSTGTPIDQADTSLPHRLVASGTDLHGDCIPKRADATHFRPRDWQEIRLDIDPGVNPQRTGTTTALQEIPAASVDGIISHHIIEHLEVHEVFIAPGEFRRVLCPGGFVVITFPWQPATTTWLTAAGSMNRHPAFDGWARATLVLWSEESRGDAALTLLPLQPGA